MEYKHISVLLNESIDKLNISPDKIYVDATLGGGGHSSEILKKLTTGHLYCFDQDEYAINKARERLSKISGNFTIIKSNFKNLKVELEKLNVEKIDGIIYDLGVSSFQFDIPDRGFSYNYDAILDMRMDTSSKLSAFEVVNEYSYHDIVKLLYKYADEKNAKMIARNIEKQRKIKKIETTFELVEVIKSSLTQKELKKKGHPAKKTFQALRIEVNNELRVFEESLEDAISMLNKDGRISVITFHSLEDRICKHMFRDKSTVYTPSKMPIIGELLGEIRLINRKPILPSEEELENNNRAHSAKLRVCEKI